MVIGDIRAVRGAMIVIELVKNGDPLQPNLDLLASIINQARINGLILLKCGIRNDVIRFLPALTIEDNVLAEGLEKLKTNFIAVQ